MTAGRGYGDIAHVVVGAVDGPESRERFASSSSAWARENLLWGAPRIHGELLMLGFTVSQATVSRYMPPANRRPGQSWRSFIRNQALAFRHDNDSEDGSAGNDAGLGIRIRFYRGILVRFLTPVIGVRVTYGHSLHALNAQPISPRSAPRHRGVLHQTRRPLAVSGRLWQAVSDRAQIAVPTRSPPCHVRASPVPRLPPIPAVRSADSRPGFGYAVSDSIRPIQRVIVNPPNRRSNSTILMRLNLLLTSAWARF